ncbi:MAG: TonB-dependent receptor plug domain-containing protein [Butyricimonas paravirosa]
MSEVVVTGMFNRRKEGFTGSAVSVKGEDLKKISTTNIAKALAAIDPSFRIMEDVLNGSNPNRLPDLRMRGQATLPGGSNAGTSAEMVTLQGEYDTYPNKPLLIMDGFEIDLQTMVDMDPDRVESITFEDAAATAIYGSCRKRVIVIESFHEAASGNSLGICWKSQICRLQLDECGRN